MDEILSEKVDALLKPEYPFSEVHPAVQRDEKTEPWLIATAGFLEDRDFTHTVATGRRYDAPTMMRGFAY